ITLQASGLTVECPGTIRVQAGSRRMVGAERVSYGLQQMPKYACVSCLLAALKSGSALASI
ncbi:hypothetical protein, partial [Caldimonas caldifontis]